jgi:dolichyl-phosphate beta-glucosyltransferase
MEKNGLGLVAGSRNHLQKNVVVTRKWYRNLLMRCCHFVVKTICGVKLDDT